MCVDLFLEIKIKRLFRKKQQNSYFICIQMLYDSFKIYRIQYYIITVQ